MQIITQKHKQMRLKRKAQVQNEIFFYIMAIIVIGLLLFLGIKWIIVIIDDITLIDMNKFKMGLVNTFDQQRKLPYNSHQKVSIQGVPGSIKKICFVQKNGLNHQNTGLCKTGEPDYNPEMCMLWGSEDPANAYFTGPLQMINVGNIQIDGDGYICTDIVNSQLSIKLVSMGDSVKIAR
jgi:hypothetical protein